MATSSPSASASDYFTSARRPRPGPSVLGNAPATPASPRTPILNRSISSQFASPGGSFRAEQEDVVVWELGARHVSVGFAGEDRPRGEIRFGPEHARRAGDYGVGRGGERRRRDEDWGREHELYTADLRSLDLGLVEDKLERAVRSLHTNQLQLDVSKPRKAILVIPSMLPTPLVEIAVKVLFSHFTHPPRVVLLTAPVMATVGAGLRDSVVVDIGWEETVVTAVGEYKVVLERRTARAGKAATRDVARVLNDQAKAQIVGPENGVGLEDAEDVLRRVCWCRSREQVTSKTDRTIRIPLTSSTSTSSSAIDIPRARLAESTETILLGFTSTTAAERPDDNDLPLPQVIFNVLLALPVDLRAICLSRLIVTGGLSNLPGLKRRILQDLQHLIATRGWDPVSSYGSATVHHRHVLAERDANVRPLAPDLEPRTPTQEMEFGAQPVAGQRQHDDKGDAVTMKAERRVPKRVAERDGLRGVETSGAWAGASLVASLRVKGVHELEREDFLKTCGLGKEGLW